MSIVFGGWVELASGGGASGWRGVVKVAPLVNNERAKFAMLFGIGDHLGFQPVTSRRGLPADVSVEVMGDLLHEYLPIALPVETFEARYKALKWYFGETWISQRELNNVNWDERAPRPDPTTSEYRLNADGTLTYVGPGPEAWYFVPRGSVELVEGMEFRHGDVPLDDQEYTEPDAVWRIERPTRRAAADDMWETVFKLMATLGNDYGEDHVRLVAWFRN